METKTKTLTSEKSEFKKFSGFFVKYLNGSKSFEEAYARASFAYKRVFKQLPYRNCESFLSDFYKSQYDMK